MKPSGQLTDQELLDRFVTTHDDAAFELLVWRYHRLVVGTCRRVCGQAADADDAAQATFLVLARKADAVRGHLSGWLYRVAYRCAVRIRNQRPSPEPVPEPIDADTDPLEQKELLAVLDAELNQLPHKYREPLVLCYLHGLTYPAAAARLGCPIGTLSGWLTRGRELLGERLTRRGVSLSAVSLAGVLGSLPVTAAPSVSTMAHTALAHSLGEPIPLRVSAAASGVLRIMMLKNAAVAAVVCFALLGGMIGLVTLAADDPPQPPVIKPAPKPRTDTDRMQGEWIYDAARTPGGANAIRWVWNSRLIFRDNAITLTNYTIPYTDQTVGELAATFTLNPTAKVPEIDIAVPQLAVWLFGNDLAKGKTIRGIYKFDGEDSLTMCLANRPTDPRPTDFTVGDTNDRFSFTVKRLKAPAKLPETVRVQVLDDAGKPVAGTRITNFGTRYLDPLHGPKWSYTPGHTTDAEGFMTVPVVELSDGTVTARAEDRNLYGVLRPTPHKLLTESPYVLRLQPGCRISGKLTSEAVEKLGLTEPWTNVMLEPGVRGEYMLGSCGSNDRAYHLYAPPGTYTLRWYGTFFETKTQSITIKPGDTELTVDLPLELNTLGKLLGQPAPELKDVKAWHGSPTTLAERKGRMVLLHFWFFDPPTDNNHSKEIFDDLKNLHEQYAGDGLDVILVALDRKQTITEPPHVINRLTKVLQREPGDFPYRVAVVHPDAGQDGAYGLVKSCKTFADYGVSHSHYAVLIGRDGRVISDHPGLSRKTDREKFAERLKAK